MTTGERASPAATDPTDTPDTPDTAGKDGFGWTFVLPLALGSTLNPINSTMISTALAPISADFHTSVAQTGWLIAGLYLTSAVAQPTMGRLADIFGSRRVYLVSLVLVALAGIVGVTARSFALLVAARVLLGVGTSGAYPSAMRIFRARADRLGTKPPRIALSMLSLASISSQALGPVLGGFLTGAFGWHAIFTVNVPLSLFTAALVWHWIADDTPASARLRERLHEIDIPGVLLFGAALLTLMVFLMNLDRPLWWTLPASGALWVAFWLYARRRPQPFIDVRMLAANLPLTVTLVRVTTTFLVPYCVMYGFAQWLETSAHYSPRDAGLMTLPMSLVAAAFTMIGARTKGIRTPFVFGAVGSLVGCAGLMLLHSDTPAWMIAGAVAFIGIPLGLSANPTQTAIFIQAPGKAMGVAAGLQRTFTYFGAIGASSLLGFIYGPRATDHGFHMLALVMTAVSAGQLLFVLLDRTLPRGKLG